MVSTRHSWEDLRYSLSQPRDWKLEICLILVADLVECKQLYRYRGPSLSANATSLVEREQVVGCQRGDNGDSRVLNLHPSLV